MALILNIETATKVCSVVLAKNGKTIAVRELNKDYSHAELITLFIEEVFKEAGLQASDIDAVAVSKGPGSYTGLRIGVSTAKGLCYALNKPLLGINSLEALSLYPALPKGNLRCPMIDARRMEVYAAIYDEAGNEVRATQADIVDEATYSAILNTQKVCFFGDGAIKCQEVLVHSNASIIDDVFPSAIYMASLSEKAFAEKKFEDVAYFEPFYLKDFVTTTPKNGA